MDPIQGVGSDDPKDRASGAATISAMLDAAWQQLRGAGPQQPMPGSPNAGRDELASSAVKRSSRTPAIELHTSDVGEFPLPDPRIATPSNERFVRATQAGAASQNPSDYARPERK